MADGIDTGLDQGQGRERRDKLSVIGPVGLVLGIASAVTFGLTALPGLVCSIIGIKRKAYTVVSWAGAVVSASSIVFFYVAILGVPNWAPDIIKRPYADSRAGHPDLPSTARNIRVNSGGFFSK